MNISGLVEFYQNDCKTSISDSIISLLLLLYEDIDYIVHNSTSILNKKSLLIDEEDGSILIEYNLLLEEDALKYITFSLGEDEFFPDCFFTFNSLQAKKLKTEVLKCFFTSFVIRTGMKPPIEIPDNQFVLWKNILHLGGVEKEKAILLAETIVKDKN